MEIHYLGTGAAEGIPAVFCNCDFCNAARVKGQSAWRTRSQVIIDGELSVDFSSEAYFNSLRFNVNLRDIKYVLITHSHMDHCYAHDFILRGYKYAKDVNAPITICGNSEVIKVFEDCTRREMKPDVAKHIKLKELSPLNEYFLGDYRVLTLPANHGRGENALLYYIEKAGKGYMYLNDTGLFDGGAFDYLKKMGAKAQLVSFDCTFIDNRAQGECARHMGIHENMIIKQKLLDCDSCDKSTKYVITHFSHNSKPTDELLEKIEREFGVTAAHDGRVFNI